MMTITPTYKDIVNYLRNELEITRDYIKEVVEKSIANAVKQAIVERLTDGRLDREIANAVRLVVTDSSTNNSSRTSSREQFEKAVENESRKQLGKILLKDFEVEFSIKPKNERLHAHVVAAVLQGNEPGKDKEHKSMTLQEAIYASRERYSRHRCFIQRPSWSPYIHLRIEELHINEISDVEIKETRLKAPELLAYDWQVSRADTINERWR